MLFDRTKLLSVAAVLTATAACASSNGNSAPKPNCGNSVAACYAIVANLDPNSPSGCGASSGSATIDYTGLTSDGPMETDSGCTGQLSQCVLTLECPSGTVFRYTFSRTGFTGTVTQGDCKANVVGSRLDSCSVSDSGTD